MPELPFERQRTRNPLCAYSPTDNTSSILGLPSGKPFLTPFNSLSTAKGDFLAPADNIKVKLPVPPTRNRLKTMEMHFYPSMVEPEHIETMSSGQFVSLHDRLLIYTSTGNNSLPPSLINKPIDKWDNEDVIKFYQNEIKGSRTVIDDKYHIGILNILRKTGVNGVQLRDCHHSLKDFQTQIFSFDVMDETQALFGGDYIKRELVTTELLKIIQLYMMRKQVSDIVPKFEIAKKIQKLRITYYEQGGRDHLPIYSSINIFDQSYKEYESILSKWKFYHYRWKKMISDLRIRHKLLSYFTVQDMRFICQESCNYKLYLMGNQVSDLQSCLQKLNAKFAFIKRNIQMDHTTDIVQKWEHLDGTIYFKELRKFILKRLFGEEKKMETENDAFPDHEIMQYATLRSRINIYLELEAYHNHDNSLRSQESILKALAVAISDQLKVFKKDWSLKETYQLLKNIEPYDERLIFGKLGEYLTTEFAAEPGPSLLIQERTSSQRLMSHQAQTTLCIVESMDSILEKDLRADSQRGIWMAPGRPHLYKVDDSDLILSRVIKCFSGHGNNVLSASQILLCTSQTSLEEVTCFLYRCCYHAVDLNRSLYCLVQPENLKSHISDEILSSLLKLIRDGDAYLAIVTASTSNRWYSDLQIYHEQLDVITDDEYRSFYLRYIGKFSGDRVYKKPACLVFVSEQECVGKSFEIAREAAMNNLLLIHIPFNSPKVDEDFVVDRLSFGQQKLLKTIADEDQDNQKKPTHLAFHLNISSHAGKDVNILLFKLLILRHITKSNGESFCIQPNHIFFIELPSQISTTYAKTNLDFVRKHFYFISGNRVFIDERCIRMNLDNFICNQQHHFVGRYLDALDKGLLDIAGPKSKKTDWDWQNHPNINMNRLLELVRKYSGNDDISIVFLKTYLDFLYRQFLILASSYVLTKNVLAVDVHKRFQKARYIQYHRVLARSFATMAASFACENYEIENPFLVQQHKEWQITNIKDLKEIGTNIQRDQSIYLDETKGNETFSLVKKWEEADPPMSFLNPGLFNTFSTPDLEKDLLFSQNHAENAFTILSRNLEECKHHDADEWRIFKKTIDSVKNIQTFTFDLFDFDKENEEKKANIEDGKIFADTEQKQKEKMRLLLRLCGGYRRFDDETKTIKPIIDETKRKKFVDKLYDDNKDYALTFDNILKIAAIFFRVQAGIPVLIMGETGCGKTRLLQYMADILSLRMIVVDVHGGYVLSNLETDMCKAKFTAEKLSPRTVLLFLDEINTSEEIASFKEIICDHSFKGNLLPNNLIVIGALNPYRRRKLTSKQLLIKKHDLKNNQIYYRNDFEKDMSKLVYTVYPLPPSMKRFVWNFGYIATTDEKQYIAVITSHSWNELLTSEQEKVLKNKSELIKIFDECRPMFSHLIFLSQCKLRDWLQDVSVCSLRDVRRANRFFVWFYNQFALDYDRSQKIKIIRCMVMALAQCYYYRLSFKRRSIYSRNISEQLHPVLRYFNQDIFEKMLHRTQDKYLEKLIIDDGIAQNRAFKENIFVMLCGIVTKTPTVVVGRPGSSKTLAMTTLEKNLSPGSNSRLVNELAISDYVVQQFQCSKLTTPDAINLIWRQCETAQNYEDAAKRVLFLDEMGLAEQSNKKPLKVLHGLLEAPTISFIGLSNWSLDSAKMNRVVLHEVAPIHTDKNDLNKTAQALAKYGPGGAEVVLINNILHKLVKFYSVLVEKQTTKDSPFKGQFHFFGARDFYNTIAYLKFCVNSLGREMNTQLLIEAICRNYGGLTEEQFDKYMEKLMFETLEIGDSWNDIAHLSTLWDEMNAINLIRSNIMQSSSVSHNPTLSNYDMRHVMLITDSEVSWKYLYDMNVLKHQNSRVIFGSKFKNDQNSSLHLHQNIEKIKNAMSSGHTVVLLHLNELYDSLYDVLNQRYLKSGVKRYSSISIRNETIRVQIDPSFRFVIVVPTTHAHHTAKDESKHTPVAFLNRLEKQYLKARNLCGQNKNWDQLLRLLEDEIESMFKDIDDFSTVFAGFVPALTFASALIYAENVILSKQKPEIVIEDDDEDEDKEDEKAEYEPITPGNIAETVPSKTISSKYDFDAKMGLDMVAYAIAILLSNCYLRHFISYQNLDLHRNKMKIINRGRPFESINDIIQHYETKCTETQDEFITLIRATTHDHFQHISDFKQHFIIKTKSDQNQMELNVNTDQMEDEENKMDIDESDKQPETERKQKPKAILINITDIASSREFTDTVNDFCIDSEYHTLIIQCTNNSNDEFLHNLHIQYLIENAKHFISGIADHNTKSTSKSSKHSGTTPMAPTQHKLILLVIYMNRVILSDFGNENDDVNDSEIAQFIQSSQYPLIFNREWKQIYCDAILPSEIKITDLNINDIYTSNIFEKRLEKHTECVIQSTFEMALNHIRFEEKMRVEVDRINRIFSNPQIDRKLKNAVIDRVKDVLKSSYDGPLDAIKRLLEKLTMNHREHSFESRSRSSDPYGIDSRHRSTSRVIVFNRKRALAIKRIISERGSFRQLIIKQISERMKSELVEVLVTILNHHSSELYSPLDIDFDEEIEFKLSERDQRRFDPKMRRIWLELLKEKKIIIFVSSKLSRLQLNDRNTQIDVDTKLTVEFPFSPYINSYFHKLRKEIETIALKDEYFKNNENILIKESFERGQIILVPIIRDILRVSDLMDSLLMIKRYIECYVYDLSVLELTKMFASRFQEDYFKALVKFVQFFILCATHQVHYKFRQISTDYAQQSESHLNGNEIDGDEDDDEDSESSGYVAHEQSDSETDSDDGGMKIGSDSDDQDDDDDKEDNSDSSESDSDSDQDSDKSSNDSDDDKKKNVITDQKDNTSNIDDTKKQTNIDEVLSRQTSSIIKYPYLIHETMAALWCNERLLHELIKIMCLLETKPEVLDEIWMKYWCNFKDKGLLICIYETLNDLLNLINNQFSKASVEQFKALISMMMDTADAITYVLNWLDTQQFDWDKLRELDSRWNLIRLYLLCYSPFDNTKLTDDVAGVFEIKRLLKKLSQEFAKDSNFDTVHKIKFICQLMYDLCQSLKLKQNSDETQDIIQYVIQQYVCSFVFHHVDFMPNETFIYYLIDLMADQPSLDEEKLYTDDEDDEIKFTANSYTKQEIASKILKLLEVNSRESTKNIRNKLNDELNNAELLSVVLLRAAESDEHSKWLQKAKKKQVPTEKDIKSAVSQLSESSEQTFLNQLRVVAKCKVLIRYVVYNLDVRNFDEKYIKSLSRLLNYAKETKQSSQSKFASLVRGLGFYFFSEFWRQKGSLDACKLRKRKKFTKILLLTHIFEPKDIETQRDDIIIMNCPYKHLDDNIFNLLKDDGHNLQSLTASKHTINKLNRTINTTLRRLRTITNVSMQQKPVVASLNNNIIEEYKASEASESLEYIDFKEVRSDTYSLFEKNTFSLLSKEMHDAIRKSKDMSSELQLQRHEVVHLIGALFNCAYLYGGKPDEKVYLWLRNQNVIPTPSRLHCLISQLLENSSPDAQLRLNLKSKKQMSLEEMLRVRLAWHLFGVAASIKQNPFWMLINDPLYYNDGYLIGMPESQQMQLLKAMAGHHVYLCPNRHLYFVADCGATKQAAKCNQCNALIGNTLKKKQHKAAKGNKKIGCVGENGEIIPNAWGSTHGTTTLPTQFLTGYTSCVGYIDVKGNNDDCVRNVSEIAVSVLRCFILCMLWLHHSERSKQFPSNTLQFMFKNGTTSADINDSTLSNTISDKIKKYINQIKKKLGKSIEDTFYVLHAIIHKLYLTFDNFYSDKDGDKKQKDLGGRAKFEAYFMSSCVEPILQNIDSSINNVRSVVSSDSFKKYWSKRVDTGFNTNDDEDQQRKKMFIQNYSPHLFLAFRHITISDFRAYVLCNADPIKYPVTSGIIDAMDQIGLSVFATKYIPSMVIWMKLVHQRLSGRINRNDLDAKDDKTFEYKYSAEWLLNRCKEEHLGDAKKAEKALIGFVDGWNHIAKRATTQKSEVGAKIQKKETIDADDDDGKDDIKENVNINVLSRVKTLDEYVRYVVISHECSTVPICVIQGKEKKKSPKPSDVALKLCINCIDASYETSLMIRGILDHLVHCNRTILTCCKQFVGANHRQSINTVDESVEELYDQSSDLIELSHINRDSDVVDLDQMELLRILQHCTQQSLEYGKETSFAMNLPLLEAKLYERYIVGRKLIDYQKHEMAFVFAGHNNIKSYVDRINIKYDSDPEILYFVECKQQLKDSIQLKLTIKTDRKKHKNDKEKTKYQLRIISNAKQGIEQTLIGLARWSNLPNQNMSISKFMKENLRLFEEEYQLFDDMNTNTKLLLKHCEGIWKLLDRLYTLKEGKWIKFPQNTPNCYRKQIKNEEWQKSIQLFVNSFDKDIMWQFLMDFKDFIERILCSHDIIKHADQSKLLTYFKYSQLNEDVIEKFPEEITLEHAADAYSIAAKQYQQIIQNANI